MIKDIILVMFDRKNKDVKRKLYAPQWRPRSYDELSNWAAVIDETGDYYEHQLLVELIMEVRNVGRMMNQMLQEMNMGEK
jgi:hypothetical protein